ncbi:MAG: sigma-54 dependent transcriptional regulator [Polyangiaceae bacterium]
MKPRVLCIDDDAAMCELLQAGLARELSVTTCTTAEAGLALVAEQDFDVVVTDLHMTGIDGLETCERIARIQPELPVVVITAFGSFDSAVRAIRAGAHDYVTKPFELEAIAHTVRRAAQHRALSAEVKRLRQVTARAEGLGDIVGQSPAIRRTLDLLARVAESSASVLVTGESGTGKELCARALHRAGPRRDRPFVAVNCAAVPEALLESELFGHVRGAFTDAKASRTGLFVEADGGTLLLDEIGDMPLSLQPKLLRALQDRAVRPVGSSTEIPFDVRIVAATHRDLEMAVSEGRFREDLFYRLDVIEVVMPPLRMRGNDVLLLAQHFTERFASAAGKQITGFGPEVAERLLGYGWPGNVRELANCIERGVALARFEQLTLDDLPDRVRSTPPKPPLVTEPGSEDEILTLEEVERRYTLRVFERTGYSRTLTAQLLGVDRKTLYRKLERWGVSGARKEPG